MTGGALEFSQQSAAVSGVVTGNYAVGCLGSNHQETGGQEKRNEGETGTKLFHGEVLVGSRKVGEKLALFFP